MAKLPPAQRRRSWSFLGSMTREELAVYLRDAERARVMRMIWLKS